MREHLSLGLCLLGACAQPQIRPDTAGPTRSATEHRDVFLSVHTADRSGGEWRMVAPGVTLSSGTQFTVSVEVPAPAYAFIGYRSGSGAIEIINPVASEAAARLEPNQPLLLPAPGKWFTLDARSGEEALFLVSQPTPDRDAAQQLLQERGEAACVKRRDPPPPDVKIRDRGFSVRGTLDDAGVAVLCMPYHHR